MSPAATPSTPEPGPITTRRRAYIIGASLLALFLGALDALVMAAAMPTVVSELGGLHFYSWVYSIYLLSRAVSLPLFGKSAGMLQRLHEAVARSVMPVFWVVLAASILCLFMCLLLPKDPSARR